MFRIRRRLKLATSLHKNSSNAFKREAFPRMILGTCLTSGDTPAQSLTWLQQQIPLMRPSWNMWSEMLQARLGLWKANVLINRSNEIMVLDPKKTGTFGTKGVDLADLVFIRSLAPLHPFSPRNKTAAFQACLTKLQVYLSLYHHSLHFWLSMSNIFLRSILCAYRPTKTPSGCFPAWGILEPFWLVTLLWRTGFPRLNQIRRRHLV